jgi:hypothetical protein
VIDDFELASRAETIAAQYTMLTERQQQELMTQIYLAQVAIVQALRQREPSGPRGFPALPTQGTCTCRCAPCAYCNHKLEA